MSEWKEGTLDEVLNVIMGQSPKGDTCNSEGIGLPLLNGPTEFGIKCPTPVQFTTDAKRVSEVGDILFCVRGSTTGRMNWADQPYAIGRGIAAIQHKEGNEFSAFGRALIDFNLPLLLSSSTGSTFPNVSRSQLENLEILIPPIEEQRAIASVLSSLDDKIDLLHRQNQTLEQMAETLYDAWFEENEFNSRVSDLIELQNGYAFKSKSFQDFGEDRVLKIKNISGGIVDIEITDFVSHETVENLDEKFSISTGDILFAMTGAKIGKMGIIPKTDYKLWLNQRVGLFKEKYYGSRFLAYLHLKSDYGKDYIENTATGSAQPNISGTGIENCEFPEITEQEIIDYSNQLAPLYEKLIFNLGQIQKLESLRNTLLPKLMSGEIRIDTDG